MGNKHLIFSQTGEKNQFEASVTGLCVLEQTVLYVEHAEGVCRNGSMEAGPRCGVVRILKQNVLF